MNDVEPDGVSRLWIETGVDHGQATTLIVIDGVDLLESQQPVQFADGSPHPAGPERFDPPDPVGLLPPDSSTLFPTTAGTAAMVGICTCGEPGCASLWLQVHREGDTVVWSPDPDAAGDTVDRSWRFDLLPYLDAVDTAAANGLAQDDTARRLARELRDALHGFGFARPGVRLLDARAWSGIPEVHLTLSTPTGLRWPAVGVVEGESVADFCLRVAHLDPDHPPELPAAPVHGARARRRPQ